MPHFRLKCSSVRQSMSGEVQGNLYITGDNPLFNTSQAEQLVKALNEKGIYSVKGDLVPLS